MRISLMYLSAVGALSSTAYADCRHPNGNIQTDPYHAPCADVLGNPLNTMCCAIERPNPSGGLSKDGFSADVCLPNGLCQQSWRRDENSSVTNEYYREECTVSDWESGKCLSVCLSNSSSRNVKMTPCDDTANSTRWCCGDNKDCCAGNIGVETLAQTFLGMLASATSVLSSSTSPSASSTGSASTAGNESTSNTSSPVVSKGSSSVSGGAIAGIVVGALAGLVLIGAAWFFIARRRRAAGSTPPMYIEEGHGSDESKTYYAHEADGIEQQVAEVAGVSAANARDHDARPKVHEMQ